MSGTTLSAHWRPTDANLGLLARAAWWTAAPAWMLLCGFLAARRLAGGMPHPPPSAALFLVAALGAAAVSLLRMVERVANGPGSPRALLGRRLLLPSLAMLLLAASLSWRACAPGGLLVLWLVLGGVEACWWYGSLRRLRVPGQAAFGVPLPGTGNLAAMEGATRAEEGRSRPRARLTQRTTRLRTLEGGELIFGVARSDFRPGERSRDLHLAFCPPLDGRPQLEVRQIRGPAAAVRIAQVEPYGARLQLRLAARPHGPQSVLVKFQARR